MMERKLNVKLSPYDPRDYKAVDLLTKTGDLPDKYLSPYITEVKDQRSSEMCLAFAGATLKEMQEWKEFGECVMMSPGYIYANRGDGYQGEGMYPREMLKMFRNHGTVPFEEFPYISTIKEVQGKFEDLSEYQKRLGYQNRINTYAKTSDVDEIKQAIIENEGVIIAIMAYESFMRTPHTGIVPMVQEGEKLLGGHAMLLVGFDDDRGAFVCQNSYGKTWGNDGFCYIPYDYNVGKEFWVVTDKVRTAVDYIAVKIDDNKLYIVNMDGSSSVYEMDTKVIIDGNNRTLIPARFPFEALGHKVEWIENMRMVKVWK